MARSSPSPNVITPLSCSPDGAISVATIAELSMPASQPSGTLNGPVAILWDIENCPVPSDVRPEDIAGNIRMALRLHPVIKGAVTLFSAYGDFNAFPRRLREGCQRTGVKLVDVPNGRKDAADKAILVDMFLFALDNSPPSSIMLISGDVDFAPALHILGQRGYTIVLVIPSGVGVSSALCNAGTYVWDWSSVSRGEGIVPPPRNYTPRVSDISGYFMNCNIGEVHDSQNEEEAIVYQGISQSESVTKSSINQMYCYNASNMSRECRASQLSAEYTSSCAITFPSSRSRSIPSGLNEAPAVDSGAQDISWVRPGDLQGLKGQIVKLLEMSGGSLPLVRLPAEYLKVFGRPLYMAEYGVFKLVHLVKKMNDTILVVGSGHKKLLCLRNSGYNDKNVKKCPITPSILKKDRKAKGVLEESIGIGACANEGSSSEDCTDDEGNAGGILGVADNINDRLKGFRQEVQELLVCYSCPVPLANFESLYEQRYKRGIHYKTFGVDTLEELLNKVRDVAVVYDEGGNRKVLTWNCIGG